MTIDSADDSKISNRTITTNRISNRTYDSKSNRITKLRRSLEKRHDTHHSISVYKCIGYCRCTTINYYINRHWNNVRQINNNYSASYFLFLASCSRNYFIFDCSQAGTNTNGTGDDQIIRRISVMRRLKTQEWKTRVGRKRTLERTGQKVNYRKTVECPVVHYGKPKCTI